MNTLIRKKGRFHSKRLACCKSFLTIFLCVFIISISIANCYLCVPVMASMSGWQYLLTVWELITTLTVGAGAAPVSSAVNQAGMASQLGQMTVAELASGEVSIAQCDAAIQALTSSTNAASQAAGGIAQSFASTAADAAQAAEAISAAGIEGVQAAEGAMSAGENLANCAAASVGTGSIVGMLGMQFTGAAAIGAGAVAVVAGVGLGILGYNIVSKFAQNIKKASSIDVSQDVLNEIPEGYNNAGITYLYDTGYWGTKSIYFGIQDGFLYKFPINPNDSSKRVGYGVYNPNGVSKGYYRYELKNYGTITKNNSNVSANNNTFFSTDSGSLGRIQDNVGYQFDHQPTLSELQSYFGTQPIPEPESPDIINPNGNYYYNPTTNNYNYNYENNPTYNTTDYTLQPIYNTDYEQFINNTNYNTTNNIDNSQTFQNFINNYLDEVSIPAPDTTPDIPTQPDKPTVPDLTPEQVEQNKEMMLPDLREYFPFCIPFDIYALFTKFSNIEREAPNLEFEIDLGSAGKYEISIDFSEWDDIADLLRSLELVGFIMLLMVSARKLIGD